MNSLLDELEIYGASGENVLELPSTPTPQTIRYLDIISASSYQPEAVVEEATSQPLAYIVDGRREAPTDNELKQWRRILALRGDASFLAVVLLGRLDVYDLGIDSKSPSEARCRQVEAEHVEAPFTFSRLHLVPSPPLSGQTAIHKALFALMQEAIDALLLNRDEQLNHLMTRADALSLVGRVVFTRFLLDRELLTEQEWSLFNPDVAGETSLFDSAKFAANTNSWLDVTFNGDFLPLGFDASCQEALEQRLNEDGWTALSNILHRAPGGQLPLRLEEESSFTWDGLDFGRIPVGVLSQVYEHQARGWHPQKQSKQSIYYTPAHIAEFMVQEAFASLEEECPKKTSQARVLDPAVGGGVFLIAAFREIFARQWKAKGRPPSTPEIRCILYEQLVGFDVELPALRLTALSLYLAAIELDPDPYPIEKLGFEPLQDKVLYHVGAGSKVAAKLGSLGPNVSDEHKAAYDLVVGNPPWTSLSLSETAQEQLHRCLLPVLEKKLGVKEAQTFSLPDNNPDVAFLWRSLEWCRPGGRLALAIHGRLLFKQSLTGQTARDQLMRAFRWTGVLNGAALRETPVWLNHKAPFALLFGVNTVSQERQPFYFFSPFREELSHRGRIRIDGEAALPLSHQHLRGKPWLLKTLFRGTRLDVGVMDTLLAAGPRLGEYWQAELGLGIAQGYRVAPGSEQEDASFLKKYVKFTASDAGSQVFLEQGDLSPFQRETLHRSREENIYKGPLLLVREAILADPLRPHTYITDASLAYNESFYGLSASGFSDSDTLLRYLLLLLSGPLFRWFCLMTSSKYGAEREAINQEDLERFPTPRLDDIGEELRAEIDTLIEVAFQKPGFHEQHRRWLGRIYQLDEWDWQTIEDSLAVGDTFLRSRKQAQRPPSNTEYESFLSTLQELLSALIGESLQLAFINSPLQSPWRLLYIGQSTETPELSRKQELLSLADQHAASQLVMPLKSGGVFVGILGQYRFWTRSRARLLALDLLQRNDIDWVGAI